MSSFAHYLAAELYQWQDDTMWLNATAVQEMLVAAAGKMLAEVSTKADVVRLRREIEPEDLTPATIVEVAEESVLLLAPEVAWLRALLLSHDETAPPRPGEPLALPTRLENGSVISIATEEFLKEKAPAHV